ncbi:DNA polymerase III subunit chi, partial [Turicimonas muris]
MSELAIHTNVVNRERYACLVLKKAQRLGMKAAVFFDNENDMDQLDNLLWTFEPSSFIPHAIARTAG